MSRSGLIAGMFIPLLAFAGGCVPAGTEGQADTSSSWTLIIFLAVVFGIFYFLMVRPQRKRQKQHQTLVHELKKGDNVITAGGIYGQIESLSDDSVVLRVEGGTTIRLARISVVGLREK